MTEERKGGGRKERREEGGRERRKEGGREGGRDVERKKKGKGDKTYSKTENKKPHMLMQDCLKQLNNAITSLDITYILICIPFHFYT